MDGSILPNKMVWNQIGTTNYILGSPCKQGIWKKME